MSKAIDVKSLPEALDKVIIITGANAGLGFETTKDLVRRGATVIMACRNLTKAKAAKGEIEKQVPSAKLDLMEVDLSSLKSVRSFAEAFQAKYDRLDTLINNAGVMMPPFSKTEDGFELQLGANYLGHFQLTGLLLKILLKTPEARVVSLSSLAHKNAKIHFDDLQSEREYNAQEAYGQSKLACLLFAYELQRRLERTGHKTRSVAAHPGLANTELSRHLPKLLYSFLLMTIGPFITHSPKAGAQPIIAAAIADVKGGDYLGPIGFREMKGPPGYATSTELAKDDTIAKRLWDISEEMCGIRYSDAMD